MTSTPTPPEHTDERWSELKRLAEAATPGPWYRKDAESNGTYGLEWIDSEPGSLRDVSAASGYSDIAICSKINRWDGRFPCNVDPDQIKANAAFIAAANPDAVLALIAELERAREALATIRDPNTTVTERCEKTDELVTFPLDLWWARFVAYCALNNDVPPDSVRRAALSRDGEEVQNEDWLEVDSFRHEASWGRNHYCIEVEGDDEFLIFHAQQEGMPPPTGCAWTQIAHFAFDHVMTLDEAKHWCFLHSEGVLNND